MAFELIKVAFRSRERFKKINLENSAACTIWEKRKNN